MSIRDFVSRLNLVPSRVETLERSVRSLEATVSALEARLEEQAARRDGALEALGAKLDVLAASARRPEVLVSNDQDIVILADGYYFLFPATQLNHAISYLHPDFDIGMRRFVAGHVRPGVHYVDVGTNVGTLAAIAARGIGPTGRIVTVEPIPELAHNIRRSLFLNGGGTPAEHHVCCAGGVGATGTVEFDVYEFDSRVSTQHSYSDRRDADRFRKIKVEVRPIASLIPPGDNDLVIKLDAEGAEPQLLAALLTPGGPLAGRDTVLAFEYAREHCERVGEDPAALVALLRAHGLSGFYIDAYSGQPTTPFGEDSLDVAGNIVVRIARDHASLA
ncbi:hypothetical protein CFHF_23090 [Caulobacter flavus]|jgi:FkbM family methyltransferase|uniref:FkbM family methyltransferase n=1 Tax=Caulobacter flavus TaxID=1679497 RepID=A0A2N5CMA9_9CAUL|nr:FkbM family methyltransferase [Caulobacter flavus]AYV49384.1 hypothetical protein C1707_25835 [Caulobacter flavus]PLR07110.1 hypothetical protein CFHF_23090 [Caulobacter flavus]